MATQIGSHTAFFYGTLMIKRILHRIIYGLESPSSHPAFSLLSSQLTFQPAILHNYCRYKVLDCDYPAILYAEGKSVKGVYVAGLTDGDIARLDVFEGEEYLRKDVIVKLEEGGEVEREAETYVWKEGNGTLENEEWSFEDFRTKKLHRWVESGVEYKDVDEAFDGEGGDPTGGRGVEGIEEVLGSAV